MSSYGNEFEYAKQFAGNLRGQSKPVPVRVETRLRTNTELTATIFRNTKALRSTFRLATSLRTTPLIFRV